MDVLQIHQSYPDELYHDTSLHNPNGAYQTVFGLDVLPKYRRNGIAENLLNYFIQISKAREEGHCTYL
ncbi:MAG: GNAT family N-acetyltransferase [Clostridium paraputrificum]